MLDIKFIRDNKKIVEKAVKDKGISLDIDKLLDIDKKRKEISQNLENFRHERNILSSPAYAKTSDGTRQHKINPEEIGKAKELKKEIKKLEDEFKKDDEIYSELMEKVPMPPAKDVPIGKTEEDNVEVKKWGTIPKFGFPVKDYLTLMRNLDLDDLKRGAKIGGFRQYVFKNEAVLLEQSVLRWSLDFLVDKGFTPMRPTVIVKGFDLFGTGMFPFGREETYKLDKDSFLSGTTEVPLMAYYSNEILQEEDLPKLYVGISGAFRKEAGSYGKDVKGIYRVHEFLQTEQIVLCKNDFQTSIKWHEALLKNSEGIMQALNIPYRVINCCSGDLALSQAKRYDIEGWVPSQNKYRETHSDSYLLDFSTRRLNIRYRTKDGKIEFAHSLNDTGIASPRILISLLENYQNKDGTIDVPEILQPYLGGHKRIPWLKRK